MAERIVPAPSLTPVATPVDRYVAPLREEVGEDPLLEVARVLEKVNPQIQQFISSRYDDQARADEAAGMQAESYVDPSAALEKNREGWKSLIEKQRAADKATGGNTAESLASASPHFRRGMFKARAQRLGLALNDHLASIYAKNPEVEVNGEMVNLHSLDDAGAMNAWVQGEINAYAEQYGINRLDPVLAAEVFQPLALRATDSLMGGHTELRNQRYKQEYMQEYSANAGMLMSHAGTGASSVTDFMGRMRTSESSGKRDVVNDLGYTGWWQFGEGRLADYNRATGKSYSLADMKGEGSEAVQIEVMTWHVNDIDAAIREEGFLGKGWSLDGLRAVAHLGGIEGMKKFVMSSSTSTPYDPSDAYTDKNGKKIKGTKLSDYYTKFAGPAVDLQTQLDTAIADGIAPVKANEGIVASVINAALVQRNPAMLGVLNDITTGSGALGNIGWVKEQVRAAEEKIGDLEWKDETRAAQAADRERADTARKISVDAFRSILRDPTGDHSEYMEAALASDNPELINAIRGIQNGVLDDIYKVRTNHEAYAHLRYDIHTATDPAERSALALRIVQGTGTMFNKSDAEQLMDSLEQSERNLDVYADSLVQKPLASLKSAVKSRFATSDAFGNTAGGHEQAMESELEFYELLDAWLEENPEATRNQARGAARSIAAEMLDGSNYLNPEAATPPAKVIADAVTPPTSTVPLELDQPTIDFLRTEQGAQLLIQLAAQAGMTLAEYATTNGILE